MVEVKALILFAHIFSFSVAIGLVTLTDLISFQFVRSGRKKKSIESFLPSMSKLVIIVTSLTILSGAVLIAYDVFFNSVYDLSPRLKAKLFICSILLANGLVLHYKFLPTFLTETKSTSIYNWDKSNMLVILFGGATSFVSWWSMLTLGQLKWFDTNSNFYQLSLFYLIVLAGAFVSTSLIFYFALSRKNSDSLEFSKESSFALENFNFVEPIRNISHPEENLEKHAES